MGKDKRLIKLKELNDYLFGETNHPLYDDINKVIDLFGELTEYAEAWEMLEHMIALVDEQNTEVYILDGDDDETA